MQSVLRNSNIRAFLCVFSLIFAKGFTTVDVLCFGIIGLNLSSFDYRDPLKPVLRVLGSVAL